MNPEAYRLLQELVMAGWSLDQLKMLFTDNFSLKMSVTYYVQTEEQVLEARKKLEEAFVLDPVGIGQALNITTAQVRMRMRAARVCPVCHTSPHQIDCPNAD
jgi:hypothetical protein